MIFKRMVFAVFIAMTAISLGSCGGSSSSPAQNTSMVPVDLSLKNVALDAGTPATFTYTIPAPAQPYTSVTIDLVKTLEAANISVTPTP